MTGHPLPFVVDLRACAVVSTQRPGCIVLTYTGTGGVPVGKSVVDVATVDALGRALVAIAAAAPNDTDARPGSRPRIETCLMPELREPDPGIPLHFVDLGGVAA